MVFDDGTQKTCWNQYSDRQNFWLCFRDDVPMPMKAKNQAVRQYGHSYSRDHHKTLLQRELLRCHRMVVLLGSWKEKLLQLSVTVSLQQLCAGELVNEILDVSSWVGCSLGWFHYELWTADWQLPEQSYKR